jgi:hypothetical protein
MVPPNHVGSSNQAWVEAWAKRIGRPFVACRVSVHAEERLAINDLESFEGLTDHRTLVRTERNGDLKFLGVANPVNSGQPIVEGAEYQRFLEHEMEKHIVIRDEYAEVTSMISPDNGLTPIDWIVRNIASVIGIFDGLRIRDGVPNMPGVVMAQLVTVGGIAGVQISPGLNGSRPLDEELKLPHGYLSKFEGADSVMNELAVAFGNAGGLRHSDLPTYHLA